MATKTLRKTVTTRGDIVAVEATTRKDGFAVRFNLSKKSGIRMVSPSGAAYYFSVSTIRSLADKLAELADSANV
jgi:hypothetical protein